MTTMFDTVTVETVPANPQAVAGYVGGSFPTYIPLVQRFPHALHLSIAVNAEEDAECLDVEAGDATPEQAPAWVRRQQLRGVFRPAIYCSVSAAVGLLRILAAAGIRRSEIRLWTAHYTGREHLCSSACGFGFTGQADATQWTDRALGRNLDQSLCADTFFGPPPVNFHYERFPLGPFPLGRRKINERGSVQRYDRFSRHPRLYARALRVLHPDLVFLRKRVWYEAHRTTPPSWDTSFRGWRWQQLDRRTK